MALGDISFGATNLKSGADADKPASPKAGDIYVSTDTNIIYVCYVGGTWTNANPELTKAAITEKIDLADLITETPDFPISAALDVDVFGTPDGVYQPVVSHALGGYHENTDYTLVATITVNRDFKVPAEVKWSFKTDSIDVAYTRLTLNNNLVVAYSILSTNYVTKTKSFPDGFNEGDVIQLYSRVSDSPGRVYVENFQLLARKKTVSVNTLFS